MFFVLLFCFIFSYLFVQLQSLFVALEPMIIEAFQVDSTSMCISNFTFNYSYGKSFAMIPIAQRFDLLLK